MLKLHFNFLTVIPPEQFPYFFMPESSRIRAPFLLMILVALFRTYLRRFAEDQGEFERKCLNDWLFEHLQHLTAILSYLPAASLFNIHERCCGWVQMILFRLIYPHFAVSAPVENYLLSCVLTGMRFHRSARLIVPKNATAFKTRPFFMVMYQE
jgi:hypothetical protein